MKSPWIAKIPMVSRPASRGGWMHPPATSGPAVLEQRVGGGQGGDLQPRHRLADLRRSGGNALRVGVMGRRSTIARARMAGSEHLKIPEPTKLASAPSCIISAASAGVAMPPAEKLGTGRRPCRRPREELERRRCSLASADSSSGRAPSAA